MKKKKSLGQHFLHSPHYLKLIADAANIKKGEPVLEIGPGDGALTAELLARGARVVAIEKDSRLIPILKEKFAGENFELHEGDALKDGPWETCLKDRPWKLVANIPYYITGALLKKFLSEKSQPLMVVFLVQKEVAERIARSKKESILSLSVKVYGAPRYIKTVPRGAFSPPPVVDSAILRIENISRKNFPTAAREKKFFELVRAGFAQKRKLLKKNLEPMLGENAAHAFARAHIPENARAEEVHLPQWLILSGILGG